MRYACFRLALLFLMPVMARAQVNPATQIRWPANCNAAGMVYNFSINGCINVSSGASIPGGSNTDVQYNNNGVFGGDAGLTYTNSPTPTLTVGGPITGPAVTVGPQSTVPANWTFDWTTPQAAMTSLGGTNASFNTVTAGTTTTQKLGTVYYVDGFPASCTVGGVNYTRQIDCAAYTALASVSGSANATLILGTNTYYTCAGINLIPAGSLGSGVLSIVGPGMLSATIKQDTACTNSVGVINLPLVTGAAQKTPVLSGFTVHGGYIANYGLYLTGATVNMRLDGLYVLDALTRPIVIGTDGTSDGWNPQLSISDIWVGGYLMGSGAAATVSISGGVPSITLTSGGSGYDTGQGHLARAWLVGYQNGTSSNPCTTMGALSVTVAAGQVTAITPTGYSGCSGTVYVQIADGNNNDYGIDLEYVTDMVHCTNLNSLAGWQASFRFLHGNNTCVGLHPEGFGQFGIENHSTNQFYGTNFGEQSVAEVDNFGTAVVGGGSYYSSIQFQGSSLFRQESYSSRLYASDVVCNGAVQTGEFHTYVIPTGVYDQGDMGMSHNKLWAIDYCGSGTGQTIFYANSFAIVTGGVNFGSNSPFSQNTQLNSYAGGMHVYDGADQTTHRYDINTPTGLTGIVAVKLPLNGGFLPSSTSALGANIGVLGTDASGNIQTGKVSAHQKFIWFGSVAGTGTVDLSTPLPVAVTLDAAGVYAVTPPAGCTTYPTINLWDYTAGSSLGNVTLTSGTSAYTLSLTSSSVIATHQLALRVSSAGSGCTTTASNITMDVLYH